MSRRSPCRTRCTCTAPAQVDHLPTRPWAHCQRRWSVDRPWWVCARQGSGALPPEVQRPVWYATHAACTWRTWQAHRRLTPASDDRTARTPISTLALSWLHCTAIPAPLGQSRLQMQTIRTVATGKSESFKGNWRGKCPPINYRYNAKH